MPADRASSLAVISLARLLCGAGVPAILAAAPPGSAAPLSGSAAVLSESSAPLSGSSAPLFESAAQPLAALGDAHDVAVSIKSVIAILPGPSALDTFRRPVGLCADARRHIFIVADTGNQRLAIFDEAGRCRGTLAYAQGRPGPVTPGVPQVRTAEPASVAIDARGRLYVLDNIGHTVEVLTALGSHLSWLEPPLPGAAASEAQADYVAVGALGNIHLLYSGAVPGLVIVEPKGDLIASLGFERGDARALRTPICVAVDPQERELAVVDPEAEREVRVLGVDGTLLAAFGTHGEAQGTLSMAVHVAWGPGHSLWVTDTIRHSISIFDDRGAFLDRIGGFGAAPGQFNYPAACAFLGDDRLVVLERAGARCQILEVETQGLRQARATRTAAGRAKPQRVATGNGG
jgi:hypothetical protein